MKKPKKSKLSQRKTALDRLAAKLRIALRRETTNIIEIGNLLIQSRKLFADQHGEWLPWLEKHFDRSERSAQRYIADAEYVAGKSDTVADFSNLSPTVLHELAAGSYTAEEEAAILTATRKGRVDQTRADDICEALRPPDDPEPDDLDATHEAVKVASYDEIAAILDGPPPEVPPPAPNRTPDYVLHQFDQAVSALKQLMTKPAARFAGTPHTTGDLRSVETFIHAVADRLHETSDELPLPATAGAR
jgi:Protein of unknown function (DUF3102)